MRRIGLAVFLAFSFPLVSLDAEGQQSGKMPRIRVLGIGGGPQTVVEPFLQGLRDLGWVDGQNVIIERRNAEGREERLPALAAELIHLKVDVILAAGGPASLNAAREATKTIPIVMVASSRDPIGAGRGRDHGGAYPLRSTTRLSRAGVTIGSDEFAVLGRSLRFGSKLFDSAPCGPVHA